MTCGLVHTSYSLPEWQAVKLTFFAPCYQNAKNQCFWCSESLDFPWEACSQPPTLLCTKILSHQNAKFACHYINKPIKNNMAVLTRCTIQCSKYFISLLLFEAPKVSLTSRFFVFTTPAYTRPLFSAYGHSKCVAVSPFSLSQTFFHFFCFLWGGGGWRRLSQLIWDTRGTIPWRKNEWSLTKNLC